MREVDEIADDEHNCPECGGFVRCREICADCMEISVRDEEERTTPSKFDRHSSKNHRAIVDEAVRRWESDELSIDHDSGPRISMADEHAWVQAWVLVEFKDIQTEEV